MSRGFESYFYFVRILFGGLDFEQKVFKTIHVVLYGKNIIKNLYVGVYDKAIVLVLCNVDSDINHNKIPPSIFDAVWDSTEHFTSCNLVLN